MIEFDQDDPRLIEERNNRKLTADKICQILSKVRNNPSSSSKRWVWELVQNAKDVPNKFGRVSVQIELTPSELIFRHNGDPFSLQNIFNLIQQVSSKDSANEDEEVTGKFGTGFIATHLLSEVIHVSGIIAHKGIHRQFQIELDRSDAKSEDMIPKINAALDRAHQVENDALYPIRDSYEENRFETDLDTVFRYPLRSEERLKSARAGIDDLVNTLPLTLVNIRKIKTVNILVKLDAERQMTYRSEVVEDDEVHSKIEVHHDADVPRHFVAFKGENLLLTSEVKDFNGLEMKEDFGKSPNLYRDFPLIGSDNFFFPFVINGQRFNPTEDRDGIVLHAVEAADAEENRGIIEEAFETAKDFTEWLVLNGAKNRYICAHSRMPNEKWEEHSKEWYKELQKEYRAFLLEQEIVETDKGIRKLEDCFIPNCGNADETKLRFHQLVRPFIGSDVVPSERIVLNWIEASGPADELDSWDRDIRYNLDSFLEDLSETGTLDALIEKLEGSESAIKWLNRVYAFVIELKETEKFDQYSILPNQNGDFKLLSDLYQEGVEAPIPDAFLDVLGRFDLDWREDLLNREVRLPGLNIEKRDLGDLSKTLNEFLIRRKHSPYGYDSDQFLEREDRLDVLIDLLRLVPKSFSKNDFRCRIYGFAKDLFGHDVEFEEVSSVNDFNFFKAIKLLIGIINETIEEAGNLEGLEDQLSEGLNGLSWVNDYLTCLEAKSDFKSELEKGNIVPNRLGKFCAFEDVQAFGTVETPLDEELIRILYELDSAKNWNSFLIAEGMTLSLPKTAMFSELGDSIDEALRAIEEEDRRTPGMFEEKKSPILQLLKWCRKHEELANRYLKYVITRSDRLWVDFTLDDEMLEIIREPENLKLLKQMASKEVSVERVMEFIDLAAELEERGINGLQKMLEHGSVLLEDKQNFDYLQAIGEEVETAFKESLEHEGLDVHVEHIGRGPFDFLISSNEDDSKKIYVEMKSYKYGSNRDFKFANSQVLRAFEEKENYIVCTLERPPDDEETDSFYVRNHLRGFSQLHAIIHPVLGHIETYKELKNANCGVRLVLDELSDPRVLVPFATIRSQSYDFNELIDRIKLRMG